MENKDDKTVEKLNNNGDNPVFEIVREIDKPIIEWSSEDVDRFMYEFYSTSPSTLQTRLSQLRKLHKHICKQKGIPPKKLDPTKKVYEYVYPDNLKAATITVKDFSEIRTRLVEYDVNGKVNARDRLIFELAWEGLTNEEMSALKEKDIEFKFDKNQNIVAAVLAISGKNKRTLLIDDQETAQDIDDCINETHHYTEDYYNSKEKRYSYVQTEYLLKPIRVGSYSKSNRLKAGRIWNILKKLFERTSYSNNNLDYLNIESIVRSRILWEFTREGTAKSVGDLVSLSELAERFGRINDLHEYKYRRMAEIIFNIDYSGRKPRTRVGQGGNDLETDELTEDVFTLPEDDDLEYQHKSCLSEPSKTPLEPQNKPESFYDKGTKRWRRNPKMAKEAMIFAEYRCESNKNHQTFLVPRLEHYFVEAHHLVPMSQQDRFNFSLDVPGNIIALCPNCHRAIHFSEKSIKGQLLKDLYMARQKLLEKFGIPITIDELLEVYGLLSKE